VVYHIYRDGVQVNGGLVAAATPYTDSGLAPNATYTYTSRAGDAAGNESVDTTRPSVTALPPTGHDGTPDDPQNPTWEKDWKKINAVISLIPAVNDLSAAASLVVDAVQLSGAFAGCIVLHQCADIGDEFGDIASDLISFIPFAKSSTVAAKAGEIIAAGINFLGGQALGWFGAWGSAA
jgi:hypothetical protein